MNQSCYLECDSDCEFLTCSTGAWLDWSTLDLWPRLLRDLYRMLHGSGFLYTYTGIISDTDTQTVIIFRSPDVLFIYCKTCVFVFWHDRSRSWTKDKLSFFIKPLRFCITWHQELAESRLWCCHMHGVGSVYIKPSRLFLFVGEKQHWCWQRTRSNHREGIITRWSLSKSKSTRL